MAKLIKVLFISHFDIIYSEHDDAFKAFNVDDGNYISAHVGLGRVSVDLSSWQYYWG